MSGDPFYRSTDWIAVRRLVRARLGRHQHCETDGCTAPGPYHYHHVLPRRIRPDLALSPDNIRVLCNSCHSKEHAKQGLGLSGNQAHHEQRIHAALTALADLL